MYEYVEELNYKISEKNYIKSLRGLFKNTEIINLTSENKGYILSWHIIRKINNREVRIHINIEFDNDILYRVKLYLEPCDNTDKTNYEMDLKLFYYEYIKGRLFDLINTEQKKYTLRVYKSIFNATPIYGFYETNGDNKIAFHTLNLISKQEPLTEHIVAFDIEIIGQDFESAKSEANNKIADFCGYLSVLLDIAFYEPTSRYMNFIRSQYIGTKKTLSHEIYRTAFWDPELNLYVKDNMNGLLTLKNFEKDSYNNGYQSISLDGVVDTIQFKTGDIADIEKVFESHRIYKIKDKIKNTKGHREERNDEINEDIHFMNSPIYIPKDLRKYMRNIGKLKIQNFDKYIFFRNACRMYLKSKILSTEGASMEMSFLVASLETLSKTEDNQSFSGFVKKYNPDVKKDELDLMYSIRSKLVHSGNFSFFEYEYDMDSISNPLYIEFRNKYLLFKRYLRKAFANWIKMNLLNIE